MFRADSASMAISVEETGLSRIFDFPGAVRFSASGNRPPPDRVFFKAAVPD